MKKTLLKFTSSVYLIAFRKFSKASFWEVNLSDLTILCDCSEKEALNACRDFKAVILNAEESVNMLSMTSDMNRAQMSYGIS